MTQTDELDDAALIDGLRNGDEAAFRTLIDRHHASLLRLAMSQVDSRAIAEEVVQETWLGVLESIGRFEGRSTLKTWLFRILIYRAKARGRKERRSMPLSDLGVRGADDADQYLHSPESIGTGRDAQHWSVAPQPWNAPEQTLLGDETVQLVEELIATLPDRQREIITLRDIEGLPATEVSELVGVTDGNQRVLLHRARTKVRAGLARYLNDV